MGLPGGGRNKVDPRVLSLFNIVLVSTPKRENIIRIFSSIFNFHLTPFPEHIKKLSAPFAEMSLALYETALASLPPTPAKFHYVFNLRDLSRVYEGLLCATVDTMDAVGSFVRLWKNECTRVFCDRLINDTDLNVVNTKINSLIKQHFPDCEEQAKTEPLLFGNFLNAAAARNEDGGEGTGTGSAPMNNNSSSSTLSLYCDLESYGAVRRVIEDVLEQYRERHGVGMGLVLFDYALEHLIRVIRAIGRGRGHALLIGVSGSGKRTLAKLASFTLGYELFEITLCRGYGEENLRENLKDLYRKLGIQNKATTFLFADAHVVKETFLESINNMLASGTVPALFPEDEKESIFGQLDTPKDFETREQKWNFFLSRCRDNLHMVLCFSPSGEALRVRARNFPALVSSCQIDWFHSWPEDALSSVALSFVAPLITAIEKETKAKPAQAEATAAAAVKQKEGGETNGEGEGEGTPSPLVTADEKVAQIVGHMVFVHDSVLKAADHFAQQLRRTVYITPKNFLDYLRAYVDILEENKRKNDEQVKRLEGGVQKLVQAAGDVEELNQKLIISKRQVDEQTAVCNRLLTDIGEKKGKAEEAQRLAAEKERDLRELLETIRVKREDAQKDLDAALPMMEVAKEALKNLRKDDITEIRSFAKPPAQVQSLSECLCHILGAKEISWKAAKGLMASSNFLNELLEFDAEENLTDRQIKGVKDIVKKTNLNMNDMRLVSQAGYGLLGWVEAVVNFYSVVKVVKPKKLTVESLLRQQKTNEKELEAIKAEARALLAQIESLNKEYTTQTKQQQELKETAELMERRLVAAKQLIAGLGTERVRWTKELESLAYKKERLIGDCLLCAAFLAYGGPFNQQFRNTLVYNEWQDDLLARGLPLSYPFRLEELLADEVLLTQWQADDLPPDELSTQNGILTTRGVRYPLCIDPQQQANQWLKKKEVKNGLIVRTFNDHDFAKQLELAITYGLPLLIEGVGESLDPLLDPVLNKEIKTVGQSKTILLGDKEVDFNEKFKLYMTTKLSNPNIDPNAFGKVAVLNYSVTPLGLQDQLLNIVVGFEHPDLAAQRDELVKARSENQRILKQCEDALLEGLANSTGNMLDNTELIQTLEETKGRAKEIAEKLEIARQTAEELDVIREGYRPAAKRGAILFFVLTAMANISMMYQYSLNAYKELFKGALEQSASDTQLQGRLNNIITTLTKRVYDWTCMGLFEKDKQTFSFQMCVDVMKGEDGINLTFLDFFLRGNTSLEKPKEKNPFPWLSEQSYHDLTKLETLREELDGLVDRIRAEESSWRTWYDLEAPEATPPPYDAVLKAAATRFHLLLFIRVFRPDRVFVAVRRYVAGEMGEKYVQPPVITYQNILDQSSPLIPVVCILSPGADPLADISKLAEKLGVTSKLKPFALGQDQGDPAAQLVENGSQRGQWVVLQNCHLLPSWLPTLEKILEKIEKPNKEFRLWLTTEPTKDFPVGILQRSLKVVTEPPIGLKLNMRTLYTKIQSDGIFSFSSHPAFHPLIYVIAFFHAVIQERRKYGSIGWNIAYDFNESDFNVSLAILASQLNKVVGGSKGPIPWPSLRYLIGEVMYGGRVIDDFDRRAMATYLEEYMGDFLFDTFQKFHFYVDDKVDYSIPRDGPIDNYIAAIEALPDVNTPEVFGLHPNAEINYYSNATKELWSCLIEMQPRTGDTGASGKREQIVSNIAQSILENVPSPFDVVMIEKAHRIAEDGVSPRELTPSEIVLLQELAHFNKLVVSMKTSLVMLRRALIGEVPMDGALEALFHSLFAGWIPQDWRKLSPTTQKNLADWLVHFTKRYAQYSEWVDHEPKVMWLAGLHIPEAYLTALIQTAGRKMGWPLDKTALVTKVTKILDPSEITERPEMGCYISGLSMEGASWDFEKSCLVRQKPKELIVNMPIIHLLPIESHRKKLQNSIEVPVYVTQARRNRMGEGFVFLADLPTKDHPSHWILQGVCLVLNTA
jgi:dynein heavy chain